MKSLAVIASSMASTHVARKVKVIFLLLLHTHCKMHLMYVMLVIPSCGLYSSISFDHIANIYMLLPHHLRLIIESILLWLLLVSLICESRCLVLQLYYYSKVSFKSCPIYACCLNISK